MPASIDPSLTPSALLETHPDGAFLVTSARDQHADSQATRAHRFATPSRGVRTDLLAPDQSLARTAAASLVCADGTVVTDLSGARLWDLPLPPWIEFDDDRPVSIAAMPDRARPQRRDVRGRRLRLPDDHLTVCRSMTVTTPARTWLDCAQYLPVEHLIAMGDAVLRRATGHERRPAPDDRVGSWTPRSRHRPTVPAAPRPTSRVAGRIARTRAPGAGRCATPGVQRRHHRERRVAGPCRHEAGAGRSSSSSTTEPFTSVRSIGARMPRGGTCCRPPGGRSSSSRPTTCAALADGEPRQQTLRERGER